MPCLPMLYDYCYARVDAYPRLEPEISRSLNLPLGFLALNSPGSHNYDTRCRKSNQQAWFTSNGGKCDKWKFESPGYRGNIARVRNCANAFSLSAIRRFIMHSDDSIVIRTCPNTILRIRLICLNAHVARDNDRWYVSIFDVV